MTVTLEKRCQAGGKTQDSFAVLILDATPAPQWQQWASLSLAFPMLIILFPPQLFKDKHGLSCHAKISTKFSVRNRCYLNILDTLCLVQRNPKLNTNVP